jgi:excisionase family DNA binding protein
MVGESALSVTQVAENLGVSRRTALRLIESGELRGHRVRGQWRVFPSDLEGYLSAISNRPMLGFEAPAIAGAGVAA